MPNWCEADLIVSGSQKGMVEEFKNAVGNNGLDSNGHPILLDMDFFIPYPKKFKEQDEKANEWNAKNTFDKRIKDGYNNGGYEWCCRNWGTKWNFSDVSLTWKPRSLLYSFQTPWGPPIPVIIKMSQMFPHLRFTLKYYEAGMGFSGKMVLKNGQIIKETENEKYRGGRGG